MTGSEMKNNIVIELRDISKKYLLNQHKSTLLGSMLNRHTNEDFWALQNINLTINRGDKIGIFGPNGAGKSTLLKIIAGITKPTSGSVFTRGKIVAFTNLEAGFDPDLTGIENIFLNGILIGMSKAEVKAKKEQIVNFADIGKFINVPFHTYSAGMKFRLAFAVAMASDCEILIMDEVFVAGDVSFQSKASQLLHSLQNQNHITTILCSHVPVLIWKFANTFYHLDRNTGLTINSKQQMNSIVNSEARSWNASFVKNDKHFKHKLLG